MASIALRTLALAGVLLSTLPVAAAHHWDYTDDGPFNRGFGSTCWWLDATCVAAHMCTGGAPPQVVDTARHCAERLAMTADDAALWVPEAAWVWVDWAPSLVEQTPSDVNAATAGERDTVNGPLCSTVWSFFCTNPIALPEHIPLDDPIGPYPLA